MAVIDKISEVLNFGAEGSIAAIIGILILALALIIVILKFLKKIIGKGMTIVLIIIILVSTGVLSVSQLKNYAVSIGSAIEQGYPEATEDTGSWFLNFIQDSAPEDAGTWVPKK